MWHELVRAADSLLEGGSFESYYLQIQAGAFASVPSRREAWKDFEKIIRSARRLHAV